MKRFFLYMALAGMVVLNNACNSDNTLTQEEPLEEAPEAPEFQGQEPFVNIPFTPIALTGKQSEKAGIDNYFAFKMFKEVSASEGKNTFFSPLSLNLALGMLYNGASGETRTEMAEALGMADFTETEINEYYLKMSKALNESDLLTELSIANSIWYRLGLPVKQPFIDVNKNYFDAMVKGLDFDKPDAADTINKWCAEKTKDKIKEIIEGPIRKDAQMYLINALYFKGQWTSVFDEKNTKKDIFTKTDKQELKVDMMEQTRYFPYYADQNVQCIELPYGNGAFSMVVMLPENKMNIEQLVEYVDNDKWLHIVEQMKGWKNIQLKMPRFKIECDISLGTPVKNAGMKRIFIGGFENISDRELFVSYIKQKTFVEVNEKGTEAAAVTVIGMVDSAGDIPPPPIPFFANRPFLYLIKEKSTGVILFIGRLDAP